jgi:hypothetical protein
MNKLLTLLATAVFAVVIFPSLADAQSETMYSYTDENGTVVFTDKKPPGRDVASQSIPPGPPPQGGNPYAQPEPDLELSAAQERRDEIAQNRLQSREAQAQRQVQCAAWAKEVARLEPNRRVFYTNDAGETVRMDDVERVNKVADLKRQIAANCR